jgi:hypothetical protein
MAAVDTFSLSRLHSLFALDAIKVPFQQARVSHSSRDPRLCSPPHAGTLLLIPPAVLYIITSVGFGYYLDRQTAVPKPAFMLGAVVVMIGECAC